MTFGEKLKQLRTNNQLTQEELAQKLYVTRTAISKWETGRGFPAIDSLKGISDLFGVSIDSLISDDDVTGQRLLEEQRAKKMYYVAVMFLIAALAFSSIAFFLHLPGVYIGAYLCAAVYVGCAFFAKPKYKRIDAKKYVVTYVLSRAVILLVILTVMLFGFFAA